MIERDVLLYSAARVKKAIIMAVLRGGVAVAGVKLLIEFGDVLFDSEPQLQQALVQFASSTIANHPKSRRLGQAIVDADRNQQRGRSSFTTCLLEEIFSLFNIQSSCIDNDGELVRRVAVDPFLVDVVIISAVGIMDHISHPYMPRLFSRPCNEAVSSLASFPRGGNSPSSTSLSLSSTLEFDHHVVYWWFPSMAWLFSIPSVCSVPCHNMGQGDDVVRRLGTGHGVPRASAVVDQIVLRTVSLTCSCITRSAHAFWFAKTREEGLRAVRWRVLDASVRAVLTSVLALLAARVTSKVSPYYVAFWASIVSGAVAQRVI